MLNLDSMGGLLFYEIVKGKETNLWEKANLRSFHTRHGRTRWPSISKTDFDISSSCNEDMLGRPCFCTKFMCYDKTWALKCRNEPKIAKDISRLRAFVLILQRTIKQQLKMLQPALLAGRHLTASVIWRLKKKLKAPLSNTLRLPRALKIVKISSEVLHVPLYRRSLKRSINQR